MRCLAEPIARQANHEIGCTGRSWEGRYKCQRLLDDAAVLACSVYVDLNPIRAGVAQTPEESQFTSVYDRVQARQTTPMANASAEQEYPQRRQAEPPYGEKSPDAWLSPVELDPRCDETREKQPSGRASNRGFLPLGLNAYLELVDWTGRQTRPDKRGQIPSHLRPILERLRISEDLWVDTVTRFGRMFHRAVGRQASLSEEAARHGRRWLAGIRQSRKVFG